MELLRKWAGSKVVSTIGAIALVVGFLCTQMEEHMQRVFGAWLEPVCSASVLVGAILAYLGASPADPRARALTRRGRAKQELRRAQAESLGSGRRHTDEHVSLDPSGAVPTAEPLALVDDERSDGSTRPAVPAGLLSGVSNRWAALAEPRRGIMLHYDASGSDAGALSWLRDPRCKVSYNWLVLDNGTVEEIAPREARAYHAGECRPSGTGPMYTYANSAFYGVAIAATDGETVTPAQEEAVVALCAELCREHTWNPAHSIVGHDTEAWPRGRKHDPTGSNPAKPVMSVARIRRLVASRV